MASPRVLVGALFALIAGLALFGSAGCAPSETTYELAESLGIDTEFIAYDSLSEDEQRIYDGIYCAIAKRSTEPVPATSDEALALFDVVLADHPELYGVESLNAHTDGFGPFVRVTVDADYTYSEEEQQELQEKVDAYAAECFSGISLSWNDYEIAKYLYDYIILNTEYDLSAPDNQSIVSVCANGRSVCSGYARTFQYLAQRNGIDCVTVLGRAKNETHAWAVAELDGDYYHLDPTWGDPQFLEDESDEWDDYVNYDCFAVTTEDIERTHTVDDDFMLPICVNTADNYYVHEGLVVDDADADELENILMRGKAEGGGYARIKCTNSAVYDEVNDLLFEQELALRLLDKRVLSYTADEETLTIAIAC